MCAYYRYLCILHGFNILVTLAAWPNVHFMGGHLFPHSKCGLYIHLSQTAFLATTAGGEFHPHRPVLERSSPFWVGKPTKWRLVSKSPGSGSDSER